MWRRLLIITKNPEFDTHGEVVLGQCEPFTGGWDLVLVEAPDKREKLATGAYSDLRKLQEYCAKHDDPVVIRRRVNELRQIMLRSVTETIAIGAEVNAKAASAAAPSAPAAASTGAASVPKLSPGGLLEVQSDNGVLVATVKQPEKADDPRYLKNEFDAVMAWQPQAVLLDLACVQRLSVDSYKELRDVRDRLRVAGARFALCSVQTAARENLSPSSGKEPLDIFENRDSALAAMKI